MIHDGIAITYKGVFTLFEKNKRRVLYTYVLMLVSTAIIPLFLFFLWDVDQLKGVIYINIIAFIIGLFIIYRLLKVDLQNERSQHPLSIGKLIGWSIGGLLLAWIGQGV